jgi:hypothetical protein
MLLTPRAGMRRFHGLDISTHVARANAATHGSSERPVLASQELNGPLIDAARKPARKRTHWARHLKPSLHASSQDCSNA